MEPQKTPNKPKQSEKEQPKLGIISPLFQVYYKAIVIQTIMVLEQKWTHRSKNRTEIPEINFHTHGQLNYRTNHKM